MTPSDECALPEIAASDLTRDALTKAIASHRLLIVRGLVPAVEAAALADGIDRAFDDCDKVAAGGPESEFYAPWDRSPEVQIPRLVTQQGFGVLLRDSPPLLSLVKDIYTRFGLFDTVTDFLGERPLLSSIKSVARRVPPPGGHPEGWHQDGAFLGETTRVLNIWLATTPCGEDAPGLDFTRTRQGGLSRVMSEDGTSFVWADEEAARHTFEQGVESPVFAAGDAVFFDHLCMHRTSGGPDFTKTRRAIETWCFAPSTYPYEFDTGPIEV